MGSEGMAGELLEAEQFFAPSSTDMVDGLIGQYRQARKRIEEVAEIMSGELGGVVSYFIEGNKSERDSWYRLDNLFALKGAIASLNSDYWNRALRLTDVLNIMPQKRRDDWYSLIRDNKTPDFDEATVRATLGDLLAMRGQFFAERVDGMFRTLSGAHVTNRPEGFGKRMIIAGVISGYGTVDYSRAGYINDLRCVIAKFMGRDEPTGSDAVIQAVRRRNGEWTELDGGALRMRIYNGVGTAHLEVHPDMAWRLNAVLASLYPMAIPPKFREKPKKKAKEFALMQRPLPVAVVDLLASMKEAQERVDDFRNPWRAIPRSRAIRALDVDKVVLAEAERVLEAIGGVVKKMGIRICWLKPA